jgi:hypothetical protein
VLDNSTRLFNRRNLEMGQNSERLIDLISSNKVILTEGAVVERLRREFGVELDEFIVYGGAIYNEDSMCTS